MLVAFCIFVVVAIGMVVSGLRQDSVRISHVTIYGSDQSLADTAAAAMRGYYAGVIPRDSTFFYPAADIRATILAAHPEIAAISIFRNGLTGLSIKIDDRIPVARWCGNSLPTASTTEASNCYLFDVNGFVYATASPANGGASSAEPINSFLVYEQIASATPPIGSTLPNAQTFPSAFDLARQLITFGSPVSSIVFRSDEVDDLLASGTRITYLLGDEQNAFAALSSALPVGRQGVTNLNLSDGSIEYIDLRFDGKIYVKKNKP